MAKRLITVLLGIVTCLFVLEIILRIVGCFYTAKNITEKKYRNNPHDYIILCIGDSFTEGMGAPLGKGYPQQLENLLRNEIKGKEIKVINKGRITFNSSMVLARLDYWLKQINPDLVVLLVGSSNSWNMWGYKKFLGKRSVFIKIQDVLFTFKVVKLIALLTQNFQDKSESTHEGSPIEDNIPPEARDWFVKGWNAQNKGTLREALSWFRKITEHHPDCVFGYICAGVVCDQMKNRAEAKVWFKKAVEKNVSGDLLHSQVYSAFVLNCWQDQKITKEDIKFLRRFEKQHPVVNDLLAMIPKFSKKKMFNSEVSEWVAFDVEEMIALCKKRGITLAVMNYPRKLDMQFFGIRKDVNSTLKEVAMKHGVIFVDNQKAFEELFLKSELSPSFFAPDGHCNEKGYGVIAHNVFSRIIKANWLKTEGLE